MTENKLHDIASQYLCFHTTKALILHDKSTAFTMQYQRFYNPLTISILQQAYPHCSEKRRIGQNKKNLWFGFGLLVIIHGCGL